MVLMSYEEYPIRYSTADWPASKESEYAYGDYWISPEEFDEQYEKAYTKLYNLVQERVLPTIITHADNKVEELFKGTAVKGIEKNRVKTAYTTTKATGDLDVSSHLTYSLEQVLMNYYLVNTLYSSESEYIGDNLENFANNILTEVDYEEGYQYWKQLIEEDLVSRLKLYRQTEQYLRSHKQPITADVMTTIWEEYIRQGVTLYDSKKAESVIVSQYAGRQQNTLKAVYEAGVLREYEYNPEKYNARIQRMIHAIHARNKYYQEELSRSRSSGMKDIIQISVVESTQPVYLQLRLVGKETTLTYLLTPYSIYSLDYDGYVLEYKTGVTQEDYDKALYSLVKHDMYFAEIDKVTRARKLNTKID